MKLFFLILGITLVMIFTFFSGGFVFKNLTEKTFEDTIKEKGYYEINNQFRIYGKVQKLTWAHLAELCTKYTYKSNKEKYDMFKDCFFCHRKNIKKNNIARIIQGCPVCKKCYKKHFKFFIPFKKEKSKDIILWMKITEVQH